jgi:hypothetical protein
LGWHQFHHVIHAHKPTGLARHEQPRNRLRFIAIRFLQPDLDVVVFVHGLVPKPGNPFIASHHYAQRVGNVGDSDAQVGSALAIDLHAKFRLVQFERCVGVQQAKTRRIGAQPLGVAVKGIEVRPQ